MPNDSTGKTALDETWRPPNLQGEPPVPPGKPTGIKVPLIEFDEGADSVDIDCWSGIWGSCLCYSVEDRRS